jgi:hypothetical protein
MGDDEKCARKNSNQSGFGPGGNGAVVYFMTIIGAAIHFISQTSGFWNVLLALLKSFVWPVFAIQKVLELLQL